MQIERVDEKFKRDFAYNIWDPVYNHCQIYIKDFFLNCNNTPITKWKITFKTSQFKKIHKNIINLYKPWQDRYGNNINGKLLFIGMLKV